MHTIIIWSQCLIFSQAAQSILRADYKPELTTEDALKLAVKVMAKTMDSTALNSEKRILLFRGPVVCVHLGDCLPSFCPTVVLGKGKYFLHRNQA